MNEQIKQLAQQSKLAELYDRYVEQCMKNADDDILDYDVIVKEFAELIVKECANICDAKRAEYTKLSKDADSFKDKNLWAEGEISAHRIRISIQEHFGVEV